VNLLIDLDVDENQVEQIEQVQIELVQTLEQNQLGQLCVYLPIAL
jgi:hypothetical protein